MKSLLAVTVLFGFVFAFSSASEVEDTCDPKVFLKLAEVAVTDVYDFYNSIGESYEGLVESGLQCAANYTDFTDLVSCAADTLTTWVQGVSGAVETFYINLIAVIQELTDDIYNCRA